MVVLSDSLMAQKPSLWIIIRRHPPFPRKNHPVLFSYLRLAVARRKQTITVSEPASQEASCALFSSAPPQSPVIIITVHRALRNPPPLPPSLRCFYFHSLSPFLPLTSVCVESLLLSQSERMSPATLYARKNLSKRIPYGQPLLSPFLTALTHLWPGIGDVGDSTLPTAVGNNGILEYIWDTGSHQPAHSQSLRLGNQGISGDSRLYFAPFRLTRFGLWFRMETSSISRSRRCSIMRNCKSKFLSL